MTEAIAADCAQSLWEPLGQIPDRRGRKGRQYGLPAILTLVLAAMLSGANDLRAVFRLHWRRDAILREDLSRIRSGSSPQAMAALRNAMLHIVRDATGPLAESRKIFAENRHAAIAAARRGFL